MKQYIVFLLHCIIWSGYTIIAWLSKHDHIQFKIILFLIFLFLAYSCAQKITISKKSAIFTTIFSLLVFYAFQNLFWVIIS